MKAVSIADAKNRLTELLYEAEEAEYLRLKSAAAGAADFAAWAQAWRQNLPAGLEGITPAELERWRDL